MFVFAGMIGLYGLGALALSSSGYRLTGTDAERTAQVIGSIGIASLLLHFYVDSFIWKVRSKEVRKALAIPEGGTASAPEPVAPAPSQWRGAVHALAYFGIPALAIGVLGVRGRTVSPGGRSSIGCVSGSAMARYARGLSASRTGDPATARAEFLVAVHLAPSFAGPARGLAELDRREGKTDSEIEHAMGAVHADPNDTELRYVLASRLMTQRRLEEAESQYREVIRLRPKFAGAYEGLGVIYKWRGELDRAIPLFRQAATLDPNYSSAYCDLAGALATLGHTPEALATLHNFRERHPEDRLAADIETAIRADAATKPPSAP